MCIYTQWQAICKLVVKLTFFRLNIHRFTIRVENKKHYNAKSIIANILNISTLKIDTRLQNKHKQQWVLKNSLDISVIVLCFHVEVQETRFSRCGKTCMLSVFCKDEFPHGYIPTILEPYVQRLEVDEKPLMLATLDTPGQHDCDHLR